MDFNAIIQQLGQGLKRGGNQIRSKIQGGSTDVQGNYYSPQDDEQLAARQAMSQGVRTANPEGLVGREQPNVANPNHVYQGVLEPRGLSDVIKSLFAQKETIPQNQGSVMGMTEDNRITNSLVDQGKLPESQREIYPQQPMATPTPTPLKPMNDYENMTAETFDQMGVPRSIAYGIGDAEGGSINRFNIGATDANPTDAVRYPDKLSEATGAAKMLSGQAEPTFYGNGEAGRQAFEEALQQPTLDEILAAIRDAGYAGKPETWKQRSIDSGGAGQFYDTWDAFVKDTPGFKKFENQFTPR